MQTMSRLEMIEELMLGSTTYMIHALLIFNNDQHHLIIHVKDKFCMVNDNKQPLDFAALKQLSASTVLQI